MKVSSLAFFLFAKCTFTVESRVGEALKEDSFKTMRMQEAVGITSSTMINRRVLVGAGEIKNIIFIPHHG
jgi:hypothetical protein